MQPSFEIMRVLGVTPGGDELVDVTLAENEPAVFMIRLRGTKEPLRIERDREAVLQDLGVIGAQLASVRFQNDIAY